MKKHIFYYFLLFTGLLGCGSEDDNPILDDDNDIKSFSFSSLNIDASIDQANSTIKAEVEYDVDITALSPTIVIVSTASITPGSQETQNFSSDVTYTVTAENGDEQTYIVSITKKDAPALTIDDIVGENSRERGEVIVLTGENWTEGEMKLYLVAGDVEYETTMVIQNATTLTILIPHEVPLGEYQLKLTDGIREVFYKDSFTIEVESPKIESVSSLEITVEDEFSITGKYFGSTIEANKVFLNTNGTKTSLQINNASSDELNVTVGDNVEAGEYTLSVESNGKESYFNENKITIKDKPTKPVIETINKTGFARGETIIITGKNLKKVGFASNLNFIPFFGGTTVARSASVNAEGTQLEYTIPSEFPLGSYEILVEVGLEYSESYDDIIKISAAD